MSLDKLDEILKTASDPAYRAETEKKYARALELHNAAIGELSSLAKGDGLLSFLSSEKREVRRQSKTQIALHQERVRLLTPYASSSPPSQPLVSPPLDLSICRELGAGEASTHSLLEAANRSTDNSVLSFEELLRPQQYNAALTPFTKTLNRDIPAETWIVRRDKTKRGIEFNVKDSADKTTLYFLTAELMHDIHVPLCRLFRAAGCLNTSVRIKLSPPKPSTGILQTRLLHLGRRMVIQNALLPEDIVEMPDRPNECPWGPRRFTYGGRMFVWRPQNPEKGQEDGNFETLYEYSGTSTNQGSLTATLNNNTSTTGVPLCWADPVPTFLGIVAGELKWTVHFAGGLDPLFKEHLIASQLAKMAAMHANGKSM